MSRRFITAVCLFGLLGVPAPSHAQAKDDFVRAFIQFSQAATGGDASAVRSALDGMAAGLAQWDAAVGRVEAGFKGAIGGAAPPDAARMRATLGAAYLERGRTLEAIPLFEAAVRNDPGFVPAHLALGLAQARLDRRQAAASAYARASSLDPASPRVAYLAARMPGGALSSEERRAALDALVAAVIAGGDAVDVTVLQLDLLDDASVDAPLFLPAVYVEGLRLLADARYPAALASLRAAAARGSADERARIAEADALVASGDRAAARASLLETVRRFPASGQAQWRLVQLGEEAGDQAAALRAAEAAARCAPVAGASIVYAAIGRLRHTALDLDAAARAYERRVALVPRSAQAHLDLGTVYQAQDRLDDALAEYLGAALVDPTSAAAFASAGQLRADQGHGESAIALLRRAVQLDANHGAARYALGRALLRAGHAEEAKQELAAFERIQRAEMEAQRRQFEENARAIESALQPKVGQ
jgi:tetratricopeptide (TPR) repeat protein